MSLLSPFTLPRFLAFLGLLTSLAGGTALAQHPGTAPSGATPSIGTADTTARLPPMQTSGALRYQCGGIGTDESTAMRAAMGRYPLSLLFARADGAYEADVGVRITAQGGSAQTMTFNAAGPVCLLQLPAGSYRVEVQGAGQSHARTVQVGGAPQTLDFRF